MQHIEQVKANLLSSWIPKAVLRLHNVGVMHMYSQVDIIKRGGHMANDPGFLRCVDAMQDVQHKELLQRSVQSFLSIVFSFRLRWSQE